MEQIFEKNPTEVEGMKRIDTDLKLGYIGNHSFKMERFESLNELTKFIKDKPLNSVFSNSRLSSEKGDYYFTKTSSYNEAQTLMTNGWEEKAKELTTTLKKLNIKNDKVNKMVFDVVGFQPSVPRYLQGIPQSMFNSKRVATKKTKILNVVKMINYASFVSTDAIERESIKALRIVQLLESEGYKCNLYINWCSRSSYVATCCETKIKSSSDRLNISKVAFPMIHPSFLRRILFAWVEHSDVTPSGHKIGYGSAFVSDTEPLYLKELSKMPEYKNTLLIPSILKDTEEEFIKKNLDNLLK